MDRDKTYQYVFFNPIYVKNRVFRFFLFAGVRGRTQLLIQIFLRFAPPEIWSLARSESYTKKLKFIFDQNLWA